LRNRDKEIRPFLILAFGPALLIIVVSLVWQSVFMYRLLIPSLPFLCVILAWPVEWFTVNRRRALMAAVFIVPVMVISLLQSYDPHYARGEDGRITTLLETIDSNWNPGDMVYHISDGTLVNYLPYATKSVGRNFIIPKCDAMFGSLSEQTRTALGVSTIAISDLNWQRAWIATVQDTPIEPACKMQEMNQYLSGDVQVVQCLPMELGRVCLYLVTK
jgi:hypothetical protein